MARDRTVNPVLTFAVCTLIGLALTVGGSRSMLDARAFEARTEPIAATIQWKRVDPGKWWLRPDKTRHFLSVRYTAPDGSDAAYTGEVRKRVYRRAEPGVATDLRISETGSIVLPANDRTVRARLALVWGPLLAAAGCFFLGLELRARRPRATSEKD